MSTFNEGRKPLAGKKKPVPKPVRTTTTGAPTTTTTAPTTTTQAPEPTTVTVVVDGGNHMTWKFTGRWNGHLVGIVMRHIRRQYRRYQASLAQKARETSNE